MCKELCQVTKSVVHCMEMYLYCWPNSITLFWNTLIFFACFDVALYLAFVKGTREFLLIGSGVGIFLAKLSKLKFEIIWNNFKVKMSGTQPTIYALPLTHWLSIKARYWHTMPARHVSGLWLTLTLTLTLTMFFITWSAPRMSIWLSPSNSSPAETCVQWY